jgi:lipid-A-disaccharide synthase
MTQKHKNIWISAGEMSGDMHAANLIRALKTQDCGITCSGVGGPDMRSTGFNALFRVEDLSVMGITEVLGHLPRILSMLRSIRRTLRQMRPDAVVLVDAPSFNFRIARYARELGIPVFYYISPKIWAWRTGRIRFIRSHVHKVISILPFEVDFYRSHGMEIEYVGNPLVDMVNWDEIDAMTPLPQRIGLLPGSRKKEITSLMPQFAVAAEIMHRRLPGLEFHCVRAPGITEDALRRLWQTDVPLHMHAPDNRYSFMRSCNMLIAASGTVTLESALLGTPTLVTYKVSPLSFAVGKRLVRVPYVSLPNLVMQREVFPELLQENADGTVLARHALAWLEHPEQMSAVRAQLATLRTMLGAPGAPARAAGIILKALGTAA